MRKFLAVLISFLIMAIPLTIIYYVFSYGIIELFGKEIYGLIIFALAILIFIWNVIKKLNKYLKRS